MAFSSGAQRNLYYVEETTYGDGGGVTPAMTEIRNTEDSINLTRDSFVSNERRGDRGIHDLRLGNKQPGGDISFEFSYGAFDDFLSGALGSDWATNTLKKGTDVKSFAVEREFSDLSTPEYQFFKGGVINGFSLDVSTNAMVTGTFSFLFNDAENDASAFHGSTSAVSATNPPFDGFTGTITEGGSSIAIISSLSLTLDNGFERNFALMSSAAPQVTSGKSNITGSVTMYFEDSTYYDKFANETESSLSFRLTDLNSNYYDITLPRIKYTSADTPVNSDGAVIVTMNYQALDDSSEASNIVITRSA